MLGPGLVQAPEETATASCRPAAQASVTRLRLVRYARLRLVPGGRFLLHRLRDRGGLLGGGRGVHRELELQ